MATAFSDDFDDTGKGEARSVRPIPLGVDKGAPSRMALVRPDLTGDFMGPAQEAYFRAKLIAWREAIVAESRSTLAQLQVDCLREPDATDRASSETDWGLELRTRDRQRKLIAKINAALRRIDAREYGYCEVTGEPIALARLEARPIATMTIEAQTKHEAREKISRDD